MTRLHPETKNDRNIICRHKIKGPLVRDMFFVINLLEIEVQHAIMRNSNHTNVGHSASKHRGAV